MYAKISRGRVGLADYLLRGKRADSKFLRNEKDNVIPLYGDLNLNRKVEKYLNAHKDYAHNYLHITLSFSRHDMDKLYDVDENKRVKVLQDLANEYISFHASGYRLDEVVAYAEAHEPIIKEEHGKERLLHIHIQIMNYNPADDTTLRTHFATTSQKDNMLATYVNKKYDFDDPMNFKIDKMDTGFETKMANNRKYLIERFKNIENMDGLKEILKKDKISYRIIKNQNSHYIKILRKKGKNINIKGRGFEHLTNNLQSMNFEPYKDMSVELLAKKVDAFKWNRACTIGERRSKKSLKRLKKHYDDKQNKRINSLNSITPLNQSHQQKIFYRHYKHRISHLLSGYFLEKKSPTVLIFRNKKKDIEIKDRGTSVSSNKSETNLEDKVALMLEIAKAKDWNLLKLRIRGAKLFRQETARQIKNLEKISAIAKQEVAISRAISIEQVYKKEVSETKGLKSGMHNEELLLIKKDLKAEVVLEYAISKYKLYAEDYNLTDDNKIDNLRNRQKPKNVIDFLCSEVNLPIKLVINTVKELYAENQGGNHQSKNKTYKKQSPKPLANSTTKLK